MENKNQNLYLLYELFDAFINYGLSVRETDKDGYTAWIAIKSKIPEQMISWNQAAKDRYKHLTVNFGIPDVKPSNLNLLDQNNWARKYFLLQHGRVVYNYPQGSLAKLFQIAYNTGQFIAENKKMKYEQAHLSYFIEEQLNKFTSFVEINSVRNIDISVYREIYKQLHSIVIGEKLLVQKTIDDFADNSYENFKSVNEKKEQAKIEEKKNAEEKAKAQSSTSSETPKTVTDTATSSSAETKSTTSSAPSTTSSEASKTTEAPAQSETSAVPAPPAAAAAETTSAPATEAAPEVKKGGNNNTFNVHFSDYIKALKKENSYY